MIAGILMFFAAAQAAGPSPLPPLPLDLTKFQRVASESGQVNYYALNIGAGGPRIHAHYRPPWESAVLGFQIEDADRARASALEWRWRALTLPLGGDECAKDKGDSAAGVHLTWKNGLKYYVLKYVWSGVGKRGEICDRKRGVFAARDTIIQESGPPLNEWRTVHVDLRAEFRRHFRDGDAKADVPDFVGVGLSTDGDQTHSESAADYADFVLYRD
jgi:hypothetical protein